jgi:hypothetical protein
MTLKLGRYHNWLMNVISLKQPSRRMSESPNCIISLVLLWISATKHVSLERRRQVFIRLVWGSILGQQYLCFRDIGFSDFIHRPGIKKQTKEQHDVSETGSVSVLR